MHFKKGNKFGNRFKKGYIPWNKGLDWKPSSAFDKGHIPFNKGKPHLVGENNSQWKGENAGHDALHKWVIERLGTPQKCSNCGTSEKRRYHWSNISHTYKRQLADWKRLCVPCHKRYDLDFIKNEKKLL